MTRVFTIRRATPVKPDRFWSRVDRSGGPTACWEWQGYRTETGYGHVRAFDRVLRAHRVAYHLAGGQLQPGMAICHRCDNPACVNPAHLFQATQLENIQDRNRKGRSNAAKGTTNPNAKLDDDRVRMIRVLARHGFTTTQLAPVFGVSATSIGYVVRRQTWAHVQEVEA